MPTRHFWNRWVWVGYDPAPEPNFKKTLWRTRLAQTCRSSCSGLHRSARLCLWFVGQDHLTKVLGKSSIYVSRSRLIYSSCLRLSPHALTFLGRTRFIASSLRHPFLGECWRGLRHFRECQACLGYCSALGSTFKRPFATLLVWRGARQISRAHLV